MSEIKRIGIDTSKAVFTLHAIDQADRPVLCVNLRRAQLLAFQEAPTHRDRLGGMWQRASLGSQADRAWP